MPSVANTITRPKRGTHFVKNSHPKPTAPNTLQAANDAVSINKSFEDVAKIDQIDVNLGFPRYEGGPKKVGWLVNMHSVSIFISEITDYDLG
jgi:DNA polymerase epsilon subunit 1